MAPLSFHPLYMPRVWGGRTLADHYQRQLPDAGPYGESWELVDRESEQSVVVGGPWDGYPLHTLWRDHRRDLFGDDLRDSERFPLLIKVLDARADLSIQVHPPAAVAPALGGEPKTEMWYIARADPGAKLYAGLKAGTTRAEFETALQHGRVADLVHALEPEAGQSIFIPSGRLHAIGAGLLIHEIQQNSDTTYRVFDWNRLGLDGHPRELHLDASLRSIDFNDYEPAMDQPAGPLLAECEHFRVEACHLDPGAACDRENPGRFALFSVIDGRLLASDGRTFHPGDFFLLPVASPGPVARTPATVLRITLP